MSDDKTSGGVNVQVLPAQSGGVTSLDGNTIAAYPTNAQFSAQQGGGAGWGGWPVVMPQPSIIVVTVDKNAGDKKEEKNSSSEVFKRL